MMVRHWVATLSLLAPLLIPSHASAAPADSSATRADTYHLDLSSPRAGAAPVDSSATRADTSATATDSTGHRVPPITIVRLPLGTTPLDRPDSAAATRPPGKERRKGPEQRFFVLGGFGFPLAPPALTSQWNAGGNFGAGMEFLLEPRFSVRIRADWTQLPFDERHFLKRIGLYGTGAAVEGGGASLVQLAAMLKLHTRGEWPRFFIEAGPGLGLVRSGDALLYDPVTATLFENQGEDEFRGAASAGGGVELLRRDGSGLFVDLHWNSIFTKGRTTQSMPFTVGILFP